jgi:hypothetical protein
MSDDKFEVAFSGEIADGADLEQVKVKVGQMFKADAAKIAHLFSGKRVVIKKDIDQQTAAKYQSALNKAGALCEVKNLSAVETAPVVEVALSNVTEPVATESGNIKTTAPEIPIDTPEAPDTDPLHITASDIDDLPMSVAPVGSDMQDEVKSVAEPELDLTGLDMAPAGSDISDKEKEVTPPQLDTEGLKIVDE